MKAAAVEYGLFSLSASQVCKLDRLFVMHYRVPMRFWWYEPLIFKNHTDKLVREFPAPTVDDYDTYANPLVLAETVEGEVDYEKCASFSHVRAKVYRPYGIRISYLNE